MNESGLKIAHELLERSYLFKTLDEDGRAEMKQLGQLVHVQAGEVLIEEGSEGGSFYVLVSGRVKVSATKEGREIVLTELGRGAVLGEVALITGQPRTASVTALEPSTFIGFADPGISDFIARHPKIKELLVRVLVHRAKDTVEKLTVS
ncbi:MAG: cyclic nucleotide-binding domain-containing protein [Myxococcales bacterium]|nr:MAG: cyclic nucleotide-binding domain-containing protein [Myxococcales bacterium]